MDTFLKFLFLVKKVNPGKSTIENCLEDDFMQKFFFLDKKKESDLEKEAALSPLIYLIVVSFAWAAQV